jgi:hypothetical protein
MEREVDLLVGGDRVGALSVVVAAKRKRSVTTVRPPNLCRKVGGANMVVMIVQRG